MGCPPCVVAVPQRSGNPDSLAKVSRADVSSGQHLPSSIIPERGQIPENDSQSAPNKEGGVFHEREAGSNLAEYSRELAPKAASLASFDAASLARARDVLARETARDNEVGSMLAHPAEGVGAVGIVGAEGLHVVPDWEAGEAVLEDALGIRLDFDGADGLHAGEDVGKQAAARSGEQMQ